MSDNLQVENMRLQEELLSSQTTVNSLQMELINQRTRTSQDMVHMHARIQGLVNEASSQRANDDTQVKGDGALNLTASTTCMLDPSFVGYVVLRSNPCILKIHVALYLLSSIALGY